MKLAALAALVLIAASILWLAAESHYRGCVQAAEARYTVVGYRTLNGAYRLTYQGKRDQAVKGCGRLPF